MTDDRDARADPSNGSGDVAESLAGDLAPIVRTVVDALPPDRAFDVATGTGRNALALAERGWTVDAVDVSRTKLSRARERGAELDGTVNWILADLDDYCVPEGAYDLVTVGFFDALDRMPALVDALRPGGVLCYEHYLASPAGDSRPRDRFRFEPNELLRACSDLAVCYYAEHRVDGEPRVTLVARNEPSGPETETETGTDVPRWRPDLTALRDG